MGLKLCVQTLTLLALLAGASAHAISDVCLPSFKEITSTLSEKFVDKIQHDGFLNLLTLKCLRYSAKNPQPLNCYSAASETIRALNCAKLNIHECFAIDYAEMIETPTATEYFNLLTEGMKKALEQGQKFDLWNTTLNFFKGNKTESLKWLAVMFHEPFTSDLTNCYIGGDEIFYPDKSRPPCSGPHHVLHTRVGNLLNKLADDNPHLITLYPIEGVPRGAGWYHFYMPAYLTAHLIDKGYSPQLASYMQTELNASYEYQYFNPKANMTNFQGDPFSFTQTKEKLRMFTNSFPPSSIERNVPPPKTDDYWKNIDHKSYVKGIRHGLNATYMGYSAAQWVLQNQTPLTRDEFSDEFSKSPEKFFRKMLAPK